MKPKYLVENGLVYFIGTSGRIKQLIGRFIGGVFIPDTDYVTPECRITVGLMEVLVNHHREELNKIPVPF